MWQLVLTSVFLGIGLAMDACAVSMTDGLNEPKMRRGKTAVIAFTFAFFQAFMPMIGWICVSFVADKFAKFAAWVPYIALVLLVIIGGKMLIDGIKHNNAGKVDVLMDTEGKNDVCAKPLTLTTLFAQAVATSIDALSTGFSLVNIAKVWWQALISVAIIAAVTFGLSFAGVCIGKKFGDRLGSKAEIVGGIILIFIGLEVFISGAFF